METYTLEESKQLIAYYRGKIIGQHLVHIKSSIAKRFELQQYHDDKVFSITVVTNLDKDFFVFRTSLVIAASLLNLISPQDYLNSSQAPNALLSDL